MLTMKTRWKTKEEEEMEKAREEGDEESGKMTMRMKLLEKERSHFRKKKLEKQIMGTEDVGKDDDSEDQRGKRLRIEAGTTTSAFQANPEDADDDDSENEGDNSENSDEDSDDDDDSDSDDDAAALMEELERIKAQRASENERKEREREQLEEMEQRDELKMGNPLLRDEMTSADDAPKGKKSATLKRRWDDDTVFRNQARDEPKREKRFVNDTIRSDFHKRFLNRYIK